MALANGIALIGAMFNDDKGKNAGAAYVFKRSANQWYFKTKFTASDAGSGDAFGWNLALWQQRAVIASTRDDDKGENSGAVYLFDLKAD